jgi:hypothetical protein
MRRAVDFVDLKQTHSGENVPNDMMDPPKLNPDGRCSVRVTGRRRGERNFSYFAGECDGRNQSGHCPDVQFFVWMQNTKLIVPVCDGSGLHHRGDT